MKTTTNDLDKVMYLLGFMNTDLGGIEEVLKKMGPPYEVNLTADGGRWKGAFPVVVIFDPEAYNFHIKINSGGAVRYMTPGGIHAKGIEVRNPEAGLRLLMFIREAKAKNVNIDWINKDNLKPYLKGKLNLEQALGLAKLHQLRGEE